MSRSADAVAWTAGRTDAAAGAMAPATYREVWLWTVLALASLALAGVFALLLAVSRVPGVETVFPWPLGFFHKALVVHVVFSFVVWFLAIFGALLAIAASREGAGSWDRALGLGAAGATAAAFPLLFVPALLDRGEPTLNDYVPVIIDPLYYAGLALVAAAVACAVLRLMIAAATGGAARTPFAKAMVGAGVVYLAALVCGGIALRLLADEPLSFTFNQELLWGAGHVLQALNTLLMLVAWTVLLAATPLGPGVPRPVLATAVGLLVGCALVAPAFYLIGEPFSAEQADAFTQLQYGFGPPALLVGGAVLIACRVRPLPWSEPAFFALAVSMPVFFVGAALGLFVDGGDTRTPAHYHGVIAGVTLAFMGLFYQVLLPALGRRVPRGRVIKWQLGLFGGGQLAASLGLFVAGGYGAPRKAAGADQGLESLGAMAGMTMNGIGGLVAVAGGVLFVVLVIRALVRPADAKIPDIKRLVAL